MDKITQLARRGMENSYKYIKNNWKSKNIQKMDIFHIAQEMAQAPLLSEINRLQKIEADYIKYCKELEEKLKIMENQFDICYEIRCKAELEVKDLEKENQKLNKLISDFIVEFNNEWQCGNPLSPKEVYELLLPEEVLRDSDKQNEPRLNGGRFTHECVSERRKDICICGHKQIRHPFGSGQCKNLNCNCEGYEEAK